MINPLDSSDAPIEAKVLPFDIKYASATTSGLEFEVKAGPNDMPIKLAKFKKRR